MSLNEFHFIRPYLLFALIPYLAILLLMLRKKLSQGNWSAVCDKALLPYLLQEKVIKISRWPLTMGAIAALLAIIAMAGPSWQRLPSPVFRNDSALVIALDLSRSMDAEDIKPSRLIRARYKIDDMLKQRKDGQTALLVYAGDAFTVTPLTDDTETITSQLEALTTDIMPSSGSNIGAVLTKAVELFKQAGLQKGQIVLITDGVELDSALAAVKGLDNYELSVLGVGSEEGAPIALPDGGFLKDRQGTIVIPKMNADELAKLAGAGKGIYQSMTTDDVDIKALLANIDKEDHKQPGVTENRSVFELWEDKGPWLLLLVLPLAALSFRKGLLSVTLLLLLPFPEISHALEWKDLWQTKDQQAASAFEQKNYEQAAKLFENPAWKAAAQYKAGQHESGEMKTPKTATGFYNQGNVLAKSGRLEDAIKAYDEALQNATNPKLIDDAEFNKELVKKELEKQKQQQKDEKQQQSEDEAEQNQGSESNENKGGETEENSQPGKPEAKPERQTEQKESSAEQQQQSRADEKTAIEKALQTQENQDNVNKQPEDEKEPAAIGASPTAEQQQANEQWLNRIPDDPAGLLKRKFKYQYGQRRRQSDNEQETW